MTHPGRWLLVALLPLALAAGAEEARPRIGLALGGGGARGLAHVGVLRWLEEHHIPVDFVAGTSMGGIVAGFYAMGHSAQEIQELLVGLDWTALLRSTPEFEERSFRRKEDAREYMARLEFGLRGGVRAPQGLSDGHPISLFLSQHALPYGGLTSFDDLPIPYRCVATDLVKAEPVVFDRGPLAEAMRATMAIPGVFSPVELDGRVLADGALLNNVPVEVVKSMGADLVIAVDVGTPLGDKGSLDTLVGIVGQSVGVMILQNVRTSLGKADVVVVPELGSTSSSDYGRPLPLVEAGYATTAGKAGLLSRLALDDATWAQHLEARRARRPAAFGTPTFLAVEGTSTAGSRSLSGRLAPLLGEGWTLERFEAELNRVYGEGRHARIGYDGLRRDGAYGLRVHAHEKRHGPPFMYTGMKLAGGTNNEFEVALRARLIVNDVLGYGSEWRTDLGLGTAFSLTSEYYRPFGSSRVFVAPRAFLTNDRSGLYASGNRVANLRTERLGVGLDVGTTFGRRSELRFGLEYGLVDSRVRVGDPLLPRYRDDLARARLRWVYDNQDSPQIPTRGTHAEVELSAWLAALGSEQAFTQGVASVSTFIPTGRRGSLFWQGRLGTTFAQTAPPYADFLLGGPLRLSAYDQDTFRGSHCLHSSVGWLYPLRDLPALIGGKVYAGAWYELGGAFGRFDQARYRSSLSAGLMAETILGPTTLAASWGEGGEQQIHFAVGATY